MKFTLFSTITFEIADPVTLIECYCFQNDFFGNFDLLPNRKVNDVNEIGARISKELLQECTARIDRAGEVPIFNYNLDEFRRLNDRYIVAHVEKLSNMIIKELMGSGPIGLSRATKILHTLYPEIIPMIDRMLQEKYKRDVNQRWREDNPSEILIDYYRNLKVDSTWQSLTQVFAAISEKGLGSTRRGEPGLTKVRVFDILWWSYLKAERLKGKAEKEMGRSLKFSVISLNGEMR